MRLDNGKMEELFDKVRELERLAVDAEKNCQKCRDELRRAQEDATRAQEAARDVWNQIFESIGQSTSSSFPGFGISKFHEAWSIHRRKEYVEEIEPPNDKP